MQNIFPYCSFYIFHVRSGSVNSVDKLELSQDVLADVKTDSSEKLIKVSPYSSTKYLNFKCPYGDVKVPKIDTSTAYILFYERSGLDYQPYLPKVHDSDGRQQVPTVDDLDDSESELRKQLCSLQ